MTISKTARGPGRVARREQKKNANRVLVRKPERKRLLGSPRRRCEDNVKMDRKRIGPCNIFRFNLFCRSHSAVDEDSS